jgi:hypothetical protein
MGQREISVIAYAGYKGEESPRSFILDGEIIDVTEMLRMWVEENVLNRTRKWCFSVRGENGYRYLISYDEQSGKWSVILK